MTYTMNLVTPHDSVQAPFVLRRVNQEGKLAVKDEYRDLVCPRCRKVDERAVLARGFHEPIRVRSKRPFLLSLDDLYLLDERSRDIFQKLVPDQVDFYPIPSSAYFVATPKFWVEPDENDDGFRFGDVRCAICKRPREVVWGKSPPKVGPPKPILAVNVEGQLGARALWLVSNEVAAELKSVAPKLTGMVIRPKEVEDGTP